MSVNEFIKDTYNVAKINNKTRQERLIFTKNQFLIKYGNEGLKRYFGGSNKKLYLEISDLTKTLT